jgi:hypothetical protein
MGIILDARPLAESRPTTLDMVSQRCAYGESVLTSPREKNLSQYVGLVSQKDNISTPLALRLTLNIHARNLSSRSLSSFSWLRKGRSRPVLEPRKPVSVATALPMTDMDDPWWGVPRKMMAEVSSKISEEPSDALHSAFTKLEVPVTTWFHGLPTCLMMMPPKLCPMKTIGSLYQCISHVKSEQGQTSLEIMS